MRINLYHGGHIDRKLPVNALTVIIFISEPEPLQRVHRYKSSIRTLHDLKETDTLIKPAVSGQKRLLWKGLSKWNSWSDLNSLWLLLSRWPGFFFSFAQIDHFTSFSALSPGTARQRWDLPWDTHREQWPHINVRHTGIPSHSRMSSLRFNTDCIRIDLKGTNICWVSKQKLPRVFFLAQALFV